MSNFRLQFNNLTIENTGPYTIEEINGLDDVEIRTANDLLTGGDGGNIWAQNYGMRRISFKGKIYAAADDDETFFTYKRAFVSAFSKSDENLPLTIRMWDGSEKTLYARVIQMPQIVHSATQRNVVNYQVAMLCEDPFYTETEEQVYTTNLIQDSGGAIPTPVPMSLSSGIGGVVVVENNGDEPVYASFEIVGPVTNPTVQNVSIEEQFQITTAISAVNTVSLEKTNLGLSVLLNESENYYPYFNGTFFKLAVGSNTIKFSASSSYDANALLTIRFKEKKLSIS